LAKIEESDAVLMLNKDFYLGESSLRELEWARMRDKRIFWLDTKDPRLNTRNDFGLSYLGFSKDEIEG
jgi:hypothetical protein